MLRRLAARVSAGSRQRKLDLFFQTMHPTAATSVVDVGVSDGGYGADLLGTANFFEALYPWPERITAVSTQHLTVFQQAFPKVTAVRAALPLVGSMTCDSADCALQWQRAQLWVSRHSVWKIVTATDGTLQTGRPSQGEQGYGFRITRRALQAGRYEIVVEAACGIAFEDCSPAWDQVKTAFLEYLRGGNDVLDGRDLTGSSIR